eukprot:9487712-Alexandrium_andersonii.AAC.1
METVGVADSHWWRRLPRDPLVGKRVIPHPLLPSLSGLFGLAVQKALKGGANLTNAGAPLASHQGEAAAPEAGNTAADVPSEFGRDWEA